MTAAPRGPRFAPLQGLRYLADPVAWFRRWSAEYGDPFLVPLMHGPMVVTHHPDAVAALFAADPDAFGIFGREIVDLFVGPRSVLGAEGDAHRRGRRLLAPSFHAGRVKQLGRTVVEVVREEQARWPADAPFRALDATQRISLQVILRALFGDEPADARAALADAILAFYRAQTTPLFIRYLRRPFLGVGPWARFQRAKAALDQALHARIAARRAAASPGEDLLGTLLAARREDGTALDAAEVRDQLVTLIGAGHETTAIVLAWALYHVHLEPALRERLRAEVAGVDDPDALAALPLLDAVVHEALRLHPAVPEITRRLLRPFTLLGHELPAGTGVVVAVNLLHENPALYPEPERFRPERFLERKFATNELVPFGGGARRCIGSALAMLELKLALATVLQGPPLRRAVDAPERAVRHSMLMSPERGVPLIRDAA